MLVYSKTETLLNFPWLLRGLKWPEVRWIPAYDQGSFSRIGFINCSFEITKFGLVAIPRYCLCSVH